MSVSFEGATSGVGLAAINRCKGSEFLFESCYGILDCEGNVGTRLRSHPDDSLR